MIHQKVEPILNADKPLSYFLVRKAMSGNSHALQF